MIDERRAPPRLVQTLGPAGDCVREALAQPELVQPPRFALLKERRLRRLRRQRGALLLALAAGIFVVRVLHHPESQPSIQAELTRPNAVVAAVSPVSSSDASENVGKAPSLPPRKLDGAAPPRTFAPRAANQETARPIEPSEPATKSAAVAPAEAEASGSAGACAQLARSGSAQAALDCYAKLAQGGGMTAELALFEQARLEGKVLRQPEGALRTLADYRQRFPEGSLRAEVMLAQIDWLLAAGDSARALQVVEEALASGLLRERTAELERLRTTLSAPAAN